MSLRLHFISVLSLLIISGCTQGEVTPRETEPPLTETPSPPTELPAGVQQSDSTDPDLPENRSPAADPEKDATGDFTGTSGILDREATRPGVAVLRSVRAARHEGFDRVVFEFDGTGLPGYHTEYIDKPVRACGSGNVVPLPGDGWLQVRMTPAQAHSEAGVPTIQEREIRSMLPNVRELEQTCDFEADVTWVLGTLSPNHYRVLELADPPRLVVDVKH